MVVKAKTFFNCFLYASANEKGNAVENDILEYVTHAQRINYGDATFKAIKDQLRTRSTSAVLYRVLQRGELALCIYKKELPSSFKVFCAKDKLNSNKKTIFVDCTGLIEYQNGAFYCKDIDRLATYLSGALVHMIYYTDPIKFVNNANLQKSSVSAFVKMFARVMDYLKVNNYLQNRDRILYIVGVYFAYNVIGMDIESAKRLSAVVNRVSEMDRKSHDLRFIEDDLTNINVFVESITRTFKLIGFNTAVLANKWLYLYGKGTLYSLELFPAFLCTIMYAYAGTYVNYWKAIETVCGKDLTDIANMVFKVGSDMYNRGASYESAEMRRNLEKVAAESTGCMTPPNGFSFKSVDDKDFNMESYTLEMELGGMINLNEEEQPQHGQQQVNNATKQENQENQPKDTATESQPTSQSQSNAEQEKSMQAQQKQAEKENPHPNTSDGAAKQAQEELKQQPQQNNNQQPKNEAAKPIDAVNNKIAKKVESAEDTMKQIKAMKESLEEKRLASLKEDKALSLKQLSTNGLESEIKDQGVETQKEVEDLVDQLDDDSPMDECGDLGDDQAAAECPIENDNPMKDKDTEAEELNNAIEADNPMHEDATTDRMKENLERMKAMQAKADAANKKAGDALDGINRKFLGAKHEGTEEMDTEEEEIHEDATSDRMKEQLEKMKAMQAKQQAANDKADKALGGINKKFGIKREDAEDLGDGVETAKAIIADHEDVGEPRKSEEVEDLVDALDDDNPM